MGAKIFSLKIISTGVVLMCQLASASKDKLPVYTHHNPSGVVKIAENLYYDQTEVTNAEWREFVFWTKHIFGEKSDEYAFAQQDIMFWRSPDSCTRFYLFNYRNNPVYDFYPVVGIRQEQAEAYSKWRGDRVFEKMLIDHGDLQWDPAQNKETYFSIERYYAGQYQNTKPNKHFNYYPVYRLPSTNERKMALQHEDLIEKTLGDNCRPPDINIPVCTNGIITTSPRRILPEACKPERKDIIYSLRGGVSEWNMEQGVITGGAGGAETKSFEVKDAAQQGTPITQTGFRNVCEWKEFAYK